MKQQKNEFQITNSQFHKYGVIRNGAILYVACELHALQECGMILWNEKREELRIVFPPECRIGTIYCVSISGVPKEYDRYVFFEDEKTVQDPYARRFAGTQKWGEAHGERCAVIMDEQQMQELAQRTISGNPPLPMEKSLLYVLHVRGFSKHSSSKVKHPGTFDAIREKIPYLKSMGITTLELMPCYEFEEYEEVRASRTAYFSERYRDMNDYSEKEQTEHKLNYWGFTKGYMMAPKASYAYDAYDSNACEEFATLVQELHRNQMEIILQLYFPDGMRQGYMLEVLKHWILQYHVDGFHLKGADLPVDLIAPEPLFANTKLFYYGFDIGRLQKYGVGNQYPAYHNLAAYEDSFMVLARKFVKGDSDTALGILDQLKRVAEDMGHVNFVSNYDTLSLQDSVMYDKKHNEENGENNQDGTDYNYSWNCGVEGPTRKNAIVKLREKQRKNLMTLLMLAQGTPCIAAGDEWLHTRKGNNNPYCQDNEISWIKWSQTKSTKEWQEFLNQLITFRSQHSVFHRTRPFEMLDARGCGYPDLSIHSDEAWKSKLNNYDHAFALLYSGVYSQEEEDIYVAYNMYWQEQDFALPKLAGRKKWYLIADTDRPQTFLDTPEVIAAPAVPCAQRSVRILIGK